MKKTIIVAILTVLVAICGIGTALPAFAATENGDVDNPEYYEKGTLNNLQDFFGYDLGEYQVIFAYHNYVLKNSGLYRAFTVTLDGEFAFSQDQIDATVFIRPQVLDSLAALFTLFGYNVQFDSTQTQISAFVRYDSMTDYYISQGIDGFETNDSQSEKVTSFFFVDYINVVDTIFVYANAEEPNLIKTALDLCLQNGAEKDKILLQYTYGTPYKSITTDADRVEFSHESQIFLHTYDMTTETADRKVTLYQHAPNATGWYGLAAIICVPCIVVPLLIYILRKKKSGEGK